MAYTDARKLSKDNLSDGEFDGEVLHDVESGELYELSNEYANKMQDQLSDSTDHKMDLEIARELLQSNLRQLTKRQQEVMYYIVQNFTEAKIASKLGISQQAVAGHLQLARKKLGKLITQTREVLKEGMQNGSNNID